MGPSSPRGALVLLLALTGCGGPAASARPVTLEISGSAVGDEAAVLRRQLARFDSLHPGVHAEVRSTPDAADTRHQLYVQWLNAHADAPDVLQLDVVWTPEFAAAGWILPLDRYEPPADSFFTAAIHASSWDGRVYALPWFVDVGMLYWRTDLMPAPPATYAELAADARSAQARGVPDGFVFQGARYEGLITTYLEVLTGFGGRILDDAGRVAVDSPEAVRALAWLRSAVAPRGISPRAVLAWHEEESRFDFQNGRAAFMRNWPYAYPLLQDTGSAVRGRFSVAPMPAAPGGRSAASLGGSELAVNRWSKHPDLAYALVAFLTAPAQQTERARVVGQYPTRPALYGDAAAAGAAAAGAAAGAAAAGAAAAGTAAAGTAAAGASADAAAVASPIAGALPIPPGQALAIIRTAVPRPVTPVYTELSGILQVALHRALTGQAEPEAALHDAAKQMRALLRRSGLAGDGAP